MFRRLITGDQGASMTEYALLLMSIALACVAILGTYGPSLAGLYVDANAGFP